MRNYFVIFDWACDWIEYMALGQIFINIKKKMNMQDFQLQIVYKIAIAPKRCPVLLSFARFTQQKST